MIQIETNIAIYAIMFISLAILGFSIWRYQWTQNDKWFFTAIYSGMSTFVAGIMWTIHNVKFI